MTEHTAKLNGYTHKGYMYGIFGYVKFEDDYGMEFRAKWLLTEYLHECIVYLDSIVGFSPYGFCVKVTGEL